ncbi:unnamed protein product, partial [Ectocarpus sp. 12 AP-2014]
EEDFGEEALRGRQLDYPPAKTPKKGAAAAAAVARSEVSTDEELAAVPAGKRGGGRGRVDEDGDTEPDGPLPEKQQQQQQKENGAGPPRKGANKNGTKAPSPPSQTTEADLGGSGAPTPARASSRRGKGGASSVVAAVTRSRRKERSKPQERGESSSDDNAGGGDDWDPTDFGEGGDADGDNEAASTWSSIASRIPFAGGVGSVTPRGTRSATVSASLSLSPASSYRKKNTDRSPERAPVPPSPLAASPTPRSSRRSR